MINKAINSYRSWAQSCDFYVVFIFCLIKKEQIFNFFKTFTIIFIMISLLYINLNPQSQITSDPLEEHHHHNIHRYLISQGCQVWGGTKIFWDGGGTGLDGGGQPLDGVGSHPIPPILYNPAYSCCTYCTHF